MTKEKLKPYIKWTIYYILLIVFYSLQTTPNLFEIYNTKPVLIVPLVVCVCMYENVLQSGIYAAFGGLLWDISADKVFGFNAIIFTICGVLISLLCIYYLHTKLVNTIAIIGCFMIVQGFFDYIFYYAIWGYSGAYRIVLFGILPSILYTAVFTIPIYFLLRVISTKFNIVVRA